MTAKYEWRDKSGLGHPSIVYLDITDAEDNLSLPIEQLLEQARTIKVKQINSFDDVFNPRGWLDRRKVQVKGYEFRWHYKVMDGEYYALFAAFVRKEYN